MNPGGSVSDLDTAAENALLGVYDCVRFIFSVCGLSFPRVAYLFHFSLGLIRDRGISQFTVCRAILEHTQYPGVHVYN